MKEKYDVMSLDTHDALIQTDCLRDAVEDLTGYNAEILGIVTNDEENPRWISVHYGPDNYQFYETRDMYLHPDRLTLSTRKRIANYILNSYGKPYQAKG